MSVFEKVYADIGDEQSIEQSLSTFSSHMTNIAKILGDTDDRTMVLFDELGAGTDPAEGAALAMSILERLHQSGSITIATTHYSELKMYAISTEGVENGCCEFDVETLKPTYKLLIGVPGKSNAFAISRRLGLSEDILNRAKSFLTQEDIQFEDVLMSIEKSRTESEKERIKAESYRIEIEKLKNELEEQKSKINAQKENIIKVAREEARRVLMSAKQEAESILAEMRNMEKERLSLESSRAAEEMRLKLKTRISSIEDSLTESILDGRENTRPPKHLKPGDSVLIVNLNQKGTVVTPPNKDGDALVQAGIMKINVNLTNLKLIEEHGMETQKSGLGKLGSSKLMTASTEIDLRGISLDDAIDSVDKFLDDACLAGLSEVTIIHGKGTGILRSGIQRFLKSNAHVKSFRLGAYGEGDSGVTLVELK